MTKKLLYAFGSIFLVVGVLGFVKNPVLGVFDTNTAHNVLHLVSGILAFIFGSRSEIAGKTFALMLGVVYLLVTVLGFIQGDGNLFGLIVINTADNFLHLLLSIVFLGIGLSNPPKIQNLKK